MEARISSMLLGKEILKRLAETRGNGACGCNALCGRPRDQRRSPGILAESHQQVASARRDRRAMRMLSKNETLMRLLPASL